VLQQTREIDGNGLAAEHTWWELAARGFRVVLLAVLVGITVRHGGVVLISQLLRRAVQSASMTVWNS
jgi:hypothetical protein